MAIWRITCRITGPGEGGPKFNVFHGRSDDAAGLEADAFLDRLETFYTSLGQDGIYADGTVITVGESVIDVETAEFVESTPRDVDPPISTGPAPELLQIVIPWRTSVRARRAMGRTFIGPLASGIVSSDKPLSSSLGNIETAADALVAASQGMVGASFGVWGYESAVPPGGTRGDDDPRVLRDWIGRGPLRNNGFSYLSSRRD